MKFLDSLFRRGIASDNAGELLKYLRIEAAGDNVEVVADINDDDILAYYSRIANFIQRCFRHHKIEHYLTAFCTLAGQKMEISVIRDGEKGPTELLEDARLEITRLKSFIDCSKAGG